LARKFIHTLSASRIEIVKEAYARYQRGDIPGVFALLSPDIEIRQTTELPWGGIFHGHEGARKFFTLLGQHTAAMPQPEKAFEAGEDVVVIGRLKGTAKSTTAAIDLDIVHVWTVRDGLLIRFCAYIDTPVMKRALGI
jgi:ketosteroid isomerase-like protein